jgi:hypothetical protein
MTAKQRRCFGWLGSLVEKRVSPLRCSKKREQLRSKSRLLGGLDLESNGNDAKGGGNSRFLRFGLA